MTTRLVFGVDRDPGVVEGVAERVSDGKGRRGAYRENPLVRVFGPGPDGVTCGTCVHLFARRFAKTYYRCDLRRDGASAASDHRVRWQACAKYEVSE